MTCNLELLIDVKTIPPWTITLLDGINNLILGDVLYLPYIKFHLICISKLLYMDKYIVSFIFSICVIQDHSLKTLIGASDCRMDCTTSKVLPK